MKVLIYIPNLDVEGAQVVATEIACGLKQRGHGVLVQTNTEPIANKLTDRLKNNRVEIIFNKGASKSYFVRNIGILFKILYAKKMFDVDIVFVHLDHLYTWILSYIFHFNIIETFHSQAYRLGIICNKKLFRKLYQKKLIYPVILSPTNYHEFLEEFDISSGERISIIPNPVNDRFFVNESQIVNKYHRNSDEVCFVFPARFHEIKNHHFLIEAFSIALQKVDGIRLVLAGTGELLETEKKYARSLNIDKKIDFLGYVEDTPELYRKSDVFIMSSKSECFPMSIIEAMASGLPVIATNVGGVKDIVKDNGILVEPTDTRGFAEAIILLAKNEKLRENMGLKSLALSKQYKSDKVIDQYERFFDEVVQQE